MYTSPWLVRRGENVKVSVDSDPETMVGVRDISASFVSRPIHVTVGGLTRGMEVLALHSIVCVVPATEDPVTSMPTSGGGGTRESRNVV